MKPKITVKNLKHAEFASQETHCYEATVYVDGKRFCKASNEGHGGGDIYWRQGTTNSALQDEIRAIGKRIEPRAFDTYEEQRAHVEKHGMPDWDDKENHIYTADAHFGIAVGDAINDALILKDMKRALANKRRIYFVGRVTKGAATAIVYVSYRKPIPADRMDECIGEVQRRNPEAIILTGRPPVEALTFWKQYA
jgi:hypothetical protein